MIEFRTFIRETNVGTYKFFKKGSLFRFDKAVTNKRWQSSFLSLVFSFINLVAINSWRFPGSLWLFRKEEEKRKKGRRCLFSLLLVQRENRKKRTTPEECAPWYIENKIYPEISSKIFLKTSISKQDEDLFCLFCF